MQRFLNVGCGRNILNGWVNLDVVQLSGVDIVADLDKCTTMPLPFPDDYFDEFLLSHLIEHIRHPLPLMQELWRIARSGAKLICRVPHGATDDAYEDPTHVRPYFGNSFGYFSQPFYWRADYGYRGDWQVERLIYVIQRQGNEGIIPAAILEKINSQRNIVREMVAELVCVKPIRRAKKELQIPHNIVIQLVD